MRCDELRARLDTAGPGGLTPAQLAHARECEACATELQAAQGVEAMLRAAPPSPSMTFSATVMSRVEATERARQRVAELPRVPVWQRWLRAVVDEPIAVVALALAPVPILLALFWPGTAANVTNFLRDAMSVWVRTETIAA
ncbi:MAG TPA: hypothetical protein VFJ50_08390, partial [Gemmatimonadales bacterium]|nr:hypothetical protein [Gemmatimonadales bacterium]